MGHPFFTKKQKALMRDRRKKKKKKQQMKMKQFQKDNENTTSTQEEGETKFDEKATEVSISSGKKLTKSDNDNKNNDEAGGGPNNMLSRKRPRENEEDLEGDGNGDGDGNETNNNNNSKKRQLELETRKVDGKIYVIIPSNIANNNKDIKKFRKDARRQLRQEDGIEDESPNIVIEFSTIEDMPGSDQNKKKKQKKNGKTNNNNFPSINELRRQQRELDELKREEAKRQQKIDSIPEEIKSRYVAMDCEMVGIGTDGKKSALARVSIVDWRLNTLLDSYVQVPVRVTDFRTHVSGVEPVHLKSQKAMEVYECRQLVATILKDKVLVGHALTNDLKALMLTHPKEHIRDTAKYRPFQRYANGKWRPRKLRDLAKENLKDKQDFQQAEHDSVQDARATMELFHLVQAEWEKEVQQSASSGGGSRKRSK